MLSIGEFARLGQVSPRMLRHYDQLGLLRPDSVDSWTGYRSYSVQQLGRLHRLVALRDLGFKLEQIGELLDQEPAVEQLRGMLRLRQAELEQTVAGEQGRLRRVEAHLRAIERSSTMQSQDVVIKTTEPLRLAEANDVAQTLSPEHVGPVFKRLVPKLAGRIQQAGAQPGMLVGHYEEPIDDGSVVVHVGFEIGDQTVPAADGIDVVELPVTEVASVIHRGEMDGIAPVYESLVRWIEDSGYRLAGYGRELYLEMTATGASVTELQVPITK
jgi:DNA-binding transcriptional MerR regulator/predicted transcriptional regulator YdeE